jgi:DNA polymerase gamma 1
VEDIDEPPVELPPLLGADLDDHFRTLGNQLTEPYYSQAVALMHAELPPMPAEWLFQAGWTRYVRSDARHRARC